MVENTIGQLYAEIEKLKKENQKKDNTIRTYQGHFTRRENKTLKSNHMLIEIKHDTNVPSDQQVIAVNKNNIIKVGFLAKPEGHGWGCIHEGGILYNVTKFITVKNFLKNE